MWESYPCSTGNGPIDLAIVQSWSAFWSKSSDFPWCSVDCIFQYTLVSGCKALHEICLDLSITAISAIVWPNHDGKLPRTAKAAWVWERYLSSFARLSRTGCHYPVQAYSTYFSLSSQFWRLEAWFVQLLELLDLFSYFPVINFIKLVGNNMEPMDVSAISV